jgi:protein O-GlcNAc transferase
MGKKSRQLRLQRDHTRTSSTAPVAATLRQAASLQASGGLGTAQMLYREVLRRQPQNFDALHMLGVIAVQTGQPERGVALLVEALRVKPDDAPALANLGNAYLIVNRPEEALRSYDRALELNPGFAGVLNNRGNALQLFGRHAEAAESFARLLELDPTFDFALGNFFHSRRHGCDWRDFARYGTTITDALDSGRRVVRPFSFLSVSASAALQLHCAQIYAAYLSPALPPPLWHRECYGHDRIRVAYVSADFRDHVVSNLMASIYEQHNPDRFHTIGVSLAAGDNSEIVERAKRALGQFEDFSALSDQLAAERIRELEVDIAVDLTGFTQGCRPGIFARRPAPVQVNFLGFPATMGVPYIDYLIADDFVVPESSASLYAEQIARLPDSFQANDDRRSALTDFPAPSRREAGLPESGLVLCSFNSSYKLNPEFFDIWTRIMRLVPDSVLWLIGEGNVQHHLHTEAASRGIEPERVVFAARLSYREHLARLRLADLFLDSLPFNAGATASDALWAGVPILTCAGEAFASRMAGSLLRAIGLPELITSSTADYEQRALELVNDRGRLAELKHRIAANRHTHPLFDTGRYCRNLEAAFTQMWQRAECGEPPESFTVMPCL